MLSAEKVAELEGMSAMEQNEVLNEVLGQMCELPTVVGGDPGMWELLRLANPDRMWQNRRGRDAVLGPCCKWVGCCPRVTLG